MRPRRGVFQVMAHRRLLSRGETKEPFCCLDTVATIEPLFWGSIYEAWFSAVITRQSVEMHKVGWIGKKLNKKQSRYIDQKKQQNNSWSRIMHTYKYAVLFLGLLWRFNTQRALWSCWFGGVLILDWRLKCSSIGVLTPGVSLKANMLKVVFVSRDQSTRSKRSRGEDMQIYLLLLIRLVKSFVTEQLMF